MSVSQGFYLRLLVLSAKQGGICHFCSPQRRTVTQDRQTRQSFGALWKEKWEGGAQMSTLTYFAMTTRNPLKPVKALHSSWTVPYKPSSGAPFWLLEPYDGFHWFGQIT